MLELLADAYRRKQRLHIKLTDGLQLFGLVLSPPDAHFPRLFQFGEEEETRPKFIAVQHVVHAPYF